MERVTVHVDGGARGNPGPSEVAAVASDGSRQELEALESLRGFDETLDRERAR